MMSTSSKNSLRSAISLHLRSSRKSWQSSLHRRSSNRRKRPSKESTPSLRANSNKSSKDSYYRKWTVKPQSLRRPPHSLLSPMATPSTWSRTSQRSTQSKTRRWHSGRERRNWSRACELSSRTSRSKFACRLCPSAK